MRIINLKIAAMALTLALSGFLGETTTTFMGAYGQANRVLTGNAVSYTLMPSGQVAMRLTGTLNLFGTSTLHDWTMSANVLQGNAQFTVGSDGKLSAINVLNFVLPVKNLKGEKDGLNDNAYEALKADTYKEIRFTMTSATITPNSGSTYTVAANGNLFIAGVTRAITMYVRTEVKADGTITCSGTQPIKMSDYKVERPSFMLGMMKTGDDLKLNYNLVFVR
jgi:polyisoprenoid-binding protein YceI